MDKTTLIEKIRVEREQLNELLARIDEARLADAGTVGDWTLKDVVAHITWHEREMAKMLSEHSLQSASDLWLMPTHERNDAIYRENRDRSLREVLDEADETYPQLMSALESLDERDLTDTSRFQDMPDDWLPWKIVAENTYEHYADHAADVRAFLARNDE